MASNKYIFFLVSPLCSNIINQHLPQHTIFTTRSHIPGNLPHRPLINNNNNNNNKHIINFKMFTKSLLMAALASVAIAAPVAQRQDSNNNFVMIATHSGNSNVHLRSINANGQRFWLGKPSATYCPSESGVDCTNYSKFPVCNLQVHF